MTAPHACETAQLPRCPTGRRWEPVTVGESGAAVFRRSDGVVFAKCAGRRWVDDLRDERDRVAWLATTDVPCAEIAGWHETDDGGCLVTTAVHGTLACDVSSEMVPRAVRSLAAVLRTLHSIPPKSCPFDRTLAVTMPVVEDVVRRGAVNANYLDPEWRGTPPSSLLAGLQSELERATRLEETDLVVCHGDACLPNFVIDPETLECAGVIDLGRLGVADRYLDLSLTTLSIGSTGMNHQYSAADADMFLQTYGLNDPDTARMRFYQILDSLSWAYTVGRLAHPS
ncbi:MAG: APH(3') family aminoglycoside O-phosphotransferase [Nocardioidaceae bacterium]